MKKKCAVIFENMMPVSALVRMSIILLVAVFMASGSLYSDENAKTAANPCYKGNCVNGKGEMNFPTGDVYKGTFRKGIMHGKGEMTWKNGDRYKGSWKDGKMDGRGEMKWANGDRYNGMWKDNQMNGTGEMTWKNGMKYTGQWKNGKQHGNGMLISTDRKVTRGKWDNGTMIVEPPKSGGIVVVGTWKNLCRTQPFDPTMSHIADVTFNANKTGVHKKKLAGENGVTDMPFTWDLIGSVLTVTFTDSGEERGGPVKHKYNFDSSSGSFQMEKEDFGPENNVSRCQLKK